MNDLIEFAIIAGTIISSVGLALGLEWLTMSAMFHLMPAQRAGSVAGHSPTDPQRERLTGSARGR